MSSSKDNGPASQSTLVIELIDKLQTQFFTDPDGDTFASCELKDHREVYRVQSSQFRKWVMSQFYVHYQTAINKQALNDAFGVIEGRAMQNGPIKDTHRRIAGHDGKVYIDMCDRKWRVIEVDADGWRILDRSPVYFIRSKAMLPLPEPRGADIGPLRYLLNVDDDGWRLVIGWLLGSLNPSCDYPMLVLSGEQGTAKSTAAGIIRGLIDPNSAPLRSVPRTVYDLLVTASNSHCTCLDNVSTVSNQISDALCRIATGGGQGTRKLYTDSDEHILNVRRPTILNGIGDLLHNSDLIDRSVFVELQPIDPSRRMTRQEITEAFESARPAILGGLLNAVSTAIRELPTVKPENWPRMADFTKWVTAGEVSLGFNQGEFLKLYAANRDNANNLAIESSDWTKAVIDFVMMEMSWEGTASELGDAIDAYAGDRRSKFWPDNPRQTSNSLKRVAPNLRNRGITVDFNRRTAAARLIRLEYSSANSSS